MFKSEIIHQKHFYLQLSSPRQEQDENDFFKFLDELLVQNSFTLVIKVEGDKAFGQEAKVKLAKWFKENKDHLEKNCIGFAKISIKQHDHEKESVMQKAFPCPYQVFHTQIEAIKWLENLTCR